MVEQDKKQQGCAASLANESLADSGTAQNVATPLSSACSEDKTAVNSQDNIKVDIAAPTAGGANVLDDAGAAGAARFEDRRRQHLEQIVREGEQDAFSEEHPEIAAWTPISTGIGGPLWSFVSGLTGYSPSLPFWALCPLWGLLVPVIAFCPVLLPMWLTQCLKFYASKHPERVPHAAEISNLNISGGVFANLGVLLAGTMIYYMVGGIMFYWASVMVNEALYAYLEAAKHSQVLQIATPEQLQYSDTVVRAASMVIGVMVLLLTVMFAVTIAALLRPFFDVVELKQRPSVLRYGLIVILKNLPGIVMLMALMYAVFMVVERWYAHLRIEALEAMIQGLPYFDVSWIFIILRLYLTNAFFMALCLTVMMSMRLLPLHFVHNKSVSV